MVASDWTTVSGSFMGEDAETILRKEYGYQAGPSEPEG